MKINKLHAGCGVSLGTASIHGRGCGHPRIFPMANEDYSRWGSGGSVKGPGLGEGDGAGYGSEFGEGYGRGYAAGECSSAGLGEG